MRADDVRKRLFWNRTIKYLIGILVTSPLVFLWKPALVAISTLSGVITICQSNMLQANTLVTSYCAYVTLPAEEMRNGSVGQWLYDKYFELRIQDQLRGTAWSDDPYDKTMELKNRTSTPIHIAKLVTKRYNPDLSHHLGYPTDEIFSSEDYTIKSLQPNESIAVKVAGNELLPKTMTVELFRSLSEQPSEFTVALGGVEIPLAGPQIYLLQLSTLALTALTQFGLRCKTPRNGVPTRTFSRRIRRLETKRTIGIRLLGLSTLRHNHGL